MIGRSEVLLAAIVLAMTAPILQPLAAQQASRMALTAALVDDQSVRIDGYPLGLDRAVRDGHTYSDKAPGQPLLGVPAYAVARAVGVPPAKAGPHDPDWGMWAVTLLSAAVAGGALVVLTRRIAEEVDPRLATVAALSAATATLLLPFSSVLFGHVLSTLLAVSAWHLAARQARDARHLVGIGALLGAAVLVEYTMVLPAVAVTGLVLWRDRKRIGWTVLGGLPAAAVLLGYQQLAFGSPFRFSYGSTAFGEEAERAGLERLDLTFAENSLRVLFGERGLLLTTPIVAVGLLGLVALIRGNPGGQRDAHLAALIAAASVIAVQLSWSNPTGGDSPGARYATAACAFVVPGIAYAWGRWRRSCFVATVSGGIVMVSATWSDPLEARDSFNAPSIWAGKLLRGDWADTVYEELLGTPAAAALLPVVAILVAVALVRSERDINPPRGARASGP